MTKTSCYPFSDGELDGGPCEGMNRVASGTSPSRPGRRKAIKLVWWEACWSNQSLVYGKAGGGRAGVDAELVVDRCQVRVDSTGTDDEPVGYLGIGQALGYQLQHFNFTCSQPSWIMSTLLRWRSRR